MEQTLSNSPLGIPLPSESPRVWLDVRSPGEYAKGHIPGAFSLPLFDDREREIVGTIYARKGRERAIEKGLALVGPRLTHLLEGAKKWSRQGESSQKGIMLYCARGGMRSSSVAWLLRLYGFDVEIYPGGFRTYRRLLPQWLEKAQRIIILRGPTGTGKTTILHHLRERGHQVIDLEGLAEHKGSAFGKVNAIPQPTNEMFMCLLIQELLRMDPSLPLFVEGESKRIGRCQIPDTFFDRMRSAELIQLTAPTSERVERIVEEYGALPKERLIHAFESIEKYLGNESCRMAVSHLSNGEVESAVNIALKYYDKEYAKSSRKLFVGRCLGTVNHLLNRQNETLNEIETLVKRGRTNEEAE